jgi:hypothetical protein
MKYGFFFRITELNHIFLSFKSIRHFHEKFASVVGCLAAGSRTIRNGLYILLAHNEPRPQNTLNYGAQNIFFSKVQRADLTCHMTSIRLQ